MLGIIAAMVTRAGLLEKGVKKFALLFVVGEERNGAARSPLPKRARFRYLVNGEPTENLLGSAQKVRCAMSSCASRLAHSAYSRAGHSAIETLLDVLQDIRRIPLPEDALLAAALSYRSSRRPRPQCDSGSRSGR